MSVGFLANIQVTNEFSTIRFPNSVDSKHISSHPTGKGLGVSFIYLKGSQVRISKLYCTYVPEIVLSLSKRADPGEMPCYAIFHLGLYCLPKYLFRGFQNTKN